MVDSCFESEYSLFEQKQDELNSIIKIGIGNVELYKEATEIKDSVEVIRWYQHQLYVKLVRALSQEEPVDIKAEDNILQKDSDGFALVALIAIDRSIGAWGKLQEYFPEKTDSILDILLHLDRLRRMTEKTLPDARNFKRPGFDDVNS
jgi:ABC-type sulfate transport system substrate-binding protein